MKKLVENKYLVFLLTIIGIALTVYSFNRQTRPDLVFDVISNNDILIIEEGLADISILYNDIDLQKNNQKLALLNIKIQNLGKGDIEESDYFSNSDFGIELVDATILNGASVINASKNFYLQNLEISIEKNTILFNKIPIETNQFFTIKIIAIVDSTSDLIINPIGNIAGMTTDISVTKSYQSKESKLDFGSIWRSVFYYIGLIVTIILILISLKIIIDSNRWERPNDEQLRKDVLSRVNSEMIEFEGSSIGEHILKGYITSSSQFLYYLTHLFENRNHNLTKIIERLNENKSIKDLISYANIEESDIKKIIEILLEDRIVVQSDKKTVMDLEFLGFFDILSSEINSVEFDRLEK